MPEIASRHHLELVNAVVDDALRQRGRGARRRLARRGHAGPRARRRAARRRRDRQGDRGRARGCRSRPVDHLQGHVAANFLAPDPIEPPFLCLIASGGHTLLVARDRPPRLRGPGRHARRRRRRGVRQGRAAARPRLPGRPGALAAGAERRPDGVRVPDRRARARAWTSRSPASRRRCSTRCATSGRRRPRAAPPTSPPPTSTRSSRRCACGSSARWPREPGARLAIGGGVAANRRLRGARRALGVDGQRAAARAVHRQRGDDRLGRPLGGPGPVSRATSRWTRTRRAAAPRRLSRGGEDEEPAEDGGRPAARALRARPRSRSRSLGAALALLGAVVVAVLLLAGPASRRRAALADAVPYDGRSPREPSGQGTRVIVALPRPVARRGRDRRPGRPARLRALARGRVGGAALGARRPRRPARRRRQLHAHVQRVRGDRADRRPRRPAVARRPRAARPALLPGHRGARRGAPACGRRPRPRRSAARRSPCSTPASTPRTRCSPTGSTPATTRSTATTTPPPAGDPRGGRRETSGTALAGILVAAGERVLPIRIAGLQPATQGAGLEDVAISDQLLAGLERAVDPDGDGATDDHVPIAVVGVNSPYAGFARLARGARGRGRGRPRHARHRARPAGRARRPAPDGTLGSPAAAPDALAVGGARRAAAPSRASTSRSAAPTRAAPRCSRASRRPAGMTTAGPVEATDPARAARGRCADSLRGRLVVVRAGDEPVARAAAAAAAGARAVLLAEPRAAGRCPRSRRAASPRPVLGVTGAAAAAVLEEPRGRGGRGRRRRAGQPADRRAAGTGAGRRRRVRGARRRAVAVLQPRPGRRRRSSPDVAAPGAALTAVPGNGGAVVGGTAVAAARAAVEAARLVPRAARAPRRASCAPR